MVLWASEIAKLGLQLVTIYVLARLLGPDAMGRYLGTTAFLFMLPRLFDAGLPQATAYFLRINTAGREPLLRLVVRHVACCAPLAMILVVALGWLQRQGHDSTFADHSALFSAYVLTELTTLLLGSLFVPSGLFLNYAAANVIAPVVNLASVTLYASMIGRPALGPVIVLLFLSSASGTLGTLAIFWIGNGARAGEIDAREFYAYGLRAWGSSFAKVLSMRLDRIVLTTLLTPALFSQYSLSVSIRDMMVLPSNLFAATLRNTQIDLVAKKSDVAAARRLVLRTAGVWSLCGLVGATIMMPFYDLVIHALLGSRYAQTGTFLRWIAFSCIPLSVIGICLNHLYALHRPSVVTAINCIALGTTPLVFFLATTLLGLKAGAIVGALVSSGVFGAMGLAAVLWATPRGPLERQVTAPAVESEPVDAMIDKGGV